ncbi:MAG TPA: hypothetical protein VGS80_11775 [Ktedonobacterales bacterium]|nr:hypothetical protein [Ktedonobacterales bacterium]
MTHDRSEPAILEGADAAPLEHLYREALRALCEVMRLAGTGYWQARFLAMLAQWDQTGEVTLFRAAGRGLSDLIIVPTNFPVLSGVQAAWLDRCLDLLDTTAETCVDVVRAPDLTSMTVYPTASQLSAHHTAQLSAHHTAQIQAMLLARGARLREQVQRLHGRPIAHAIWQVIDRSWRVRELHSLSGSRCRVCWRRYVTPAEVAFAAAGRWLRRTLPTALVRGDGVQIVQRAAACEQDRACLRAQRAIQAAVARARPVVLQSQEDAPVCPHCGTRCNAEGLRWDLLEHPLRLRERPAPSS